MEIVAHSIISFRFSQNRNSSKPHSNFFKFTETEISKKNSDIYLKTSISKVILHLPKNKKLRNCFLQLSEKNIIYGC